ncbi:integrase family protein [Methylocella silvestris BL2]|uniref:Integrase family protein n=1 Tax=Methylocella silvestris (strain DSM 15510 / CIP 108128 / LMG 27833 / NCIMB 13906 / BL2) TaxID=395965 RepID=B8ERI0_METSB|nr:site-specific integrase [Methylocella silvestris]ACK51032.1 integrase family protein [Methylocella silvestris BL2]
MAKNLTIKGIAALKPQAKRCEVPDGHTRGLYFVVQPSGAKSWAYRFSFEGKPKKLTIGSYPAIDLSRARSIALASATKVANGRNPAAEKKVEREKARKPSDLDLVDVVVAQFVVKHVEPKTRPQSAKEMKRILKREILSRWSGRRLTEITRSDIRDLLEAIADRAPIMANRVFEVISSLINWSISMEMLSASPIAGLRKPSPAKRRDRILSEKELTDVWQASERAGWPYGSMIKVLILSGQRRSEVSDMTWSEIDFEERSWTLPAVRTKNGKGHIIPLSPTIIDVLLTLPRIGSESGFVFTTNGFSPIRNFARRKKALMMSCQSENNWTLHDLRRTFATGMARLKVELPVVEKLLNHSSGTFGGVQGVYQQYDFQSEKREAMNLWASYVNKITNKLDTIK